jgi:hypothetical protein
MSDADRRSTPPADAPMAVAATARGVHFGEFGDISGFWRTVENALFSRRKRWFPRRDKKPLARI